MAASVPVLQLNASMQQSASLFSESFRSSAASSSRSASASPRLRKSGLVSTASGFFSGPPSARTLSELSKDPELASLEARQSALVARRVELLKRQAAVSKELAGESRAMLQDTLRGVHNTQRAVTEAQKRGAWSYHVSPQRVAQHDASNYLGARTAELASMQAEVQAGQEEERLLVAAMQGLSSHRAVSAVNSLSSWRATYGNPNGSLAQASPGYASEWAPLPKYYGPPAPLSPHGHKRKQYYPGFASSAVTLKLGRDLQ
jgi:hypothetical protein